VMGMLPMNKGRSPCWGMDLSAKGGGEAGAHRLESNIQQKGKKYSEKCLNIFVM
jgi:hypothetical protein